jgi:hypothetical protein
MHLPASLSACVTVTANGSSRLSQFRGTPKPENCPQIGVDLSEVSDLPMYRVHPALLARSTTSTPFARDLKLPRNTNLRTEIYAVYSKELKRFY